jgi:hypothetical protein
VVLPADHPCAETVDSTGYSCISVFESVVDGGFGKLLKLEEGATLELGRFEQTQAAEQVSSQATGAPESSRAADGVDYTPASRNDRPRKRFTGFNFRKRSADRSVAGPAIPIVDAEASPTTGEGSTEKEDKEDMKVGVRVTIRLSALDEDEIDMSLANEQVTYLHVVRFGPAPAEDEEDSRPWVVKVVKREATVRFASNRLIIVSFYRSVDRASHIPLARDLRSLISVHVIPTPGDLSLVGCTHLSASICARSASARG